MNILLPYKLQHHTFLNILLVHILRLGQKLFGVPNFFHRNLDGTLYFSSLYFHFSGVYALIFYVEPDGFSFVSIGRGT
jgi:hypothetical protein